MNNCSTCNKLTHRRLCFLCQRKARQQQAALQRMHAIVTALQLHKTEQQRTRQESEKR